MGCRKSKYRIPEGELRFLLENTSFSKQQIEEWFNGFMKDCPSGELTQKKFHKVYKELFPSGNAEKFCEHIFRTFDVDGSGKIEFREFLMAINTTSKSSPKKKLRWAFKMYDIDGNGYIDKSEMRKIIQSICDLTGASSSNEEELNLRTEKIFESFDTNKNGVITEDEFITGCTDDQLVYNILVDQTCEI
ncbi:hypothetical protein ACOME3_005701 [Neoechinorhynchus agilis]